MSDEDKAWLSQMLCTGLRVTFVETRSTWIEGEQKPFEQNAFPFKCQMLQHADDRVRVYFHQQTSDGEPLGGKTRMANGKRLTDAESDELSPIQRVTFERNKDHSTNIEIEMIAEFNDLTAQQVVYHNEIE